MRNFSAKPLSFERKREVLSLRPRTIKPGFTLIEVVVVIALVGILSVAIATFYSYGNKMYRQGLEKISVDEECARTIQDFEGISRGATQVITATTNTFEFFAYLRGDLEPAPSKVKYYTIYNTLYRSVILPQGTGPTYLYPEEKATVTTVAESLSDTNLFAYYNDASNLLSFPVQRDAVKMAQITITVDANPALPPDPISQSTFVQFRNLKTNL